MGFAEEVLGQLEGFFLSLFPIFSSFFQSILDSIGNAFVIVIQSSFIPAGLFSPEEIVLIFGLTFASAMGSFAFVKGLGDMTGGE